jgi:hypothetical protein
MLQGSVSTAQAQRLKEANKLPRFAKSMKDLPLRFLALSDAPWATRPDGSSQRGYFVKLTPRTAFSDEEEVDYAVLDWRSHKPARVARSNLNAETQAAAGAADALEYVKVFWSLIHHPECEVLDPTLRARATSARS